MYRHDPTLLHGSVPLARTQWRPPSAESEDEPSLFGLRWRLIERIRREIAAGMYDTDERWEKALEGLFQALEEQ